MTGIDGFFGRNLTKRWMAKYDLIGIDLPRELFDEDEETLKWQQTINHVDLRDEANFYSFLLDGVDTVLPALASTQVGTSMLIITQLI